MGVRLVKYNRTAEGNENSYYNDHDYLVNRDLANQHPIYAISGLQEVLNVLEDNIKETNKLLLEKDKATNIRIDNLILDIEKIQQDILNILDIIDNLNVIKDVKDTFTIDLDYDDTNKILKGDVKIYNDPKETNSIQVTSQGLYVPKIITEDTETITWTSVSLGESLSDIFNSGSKFSHNTSSWSNMFSPSEANRWYWNDSLQSFVQPLNTSYFNGFITQNTYDYYTHTATIRSTGADNDVNGIVIAHVIDDVGNPHTLTALCIRRGWNNSADWLLAYDYYLPDQTILFRAGNGPSGTIPGSSGSSNWNKFSNGITVRITKNENIITAACSDWNSNVINENTLITINLDDYSWGYLFRADVKYGYCNLSQPNSYFTNIDFQSKMSASSSKLLANVKISAESDNAIEQKSDGLYAPILRISEQDNNALEKVSDGYFVEKINISKKPDNALEKINDGLFVQHYSIIKSVTQDNHNFNVGDFIFYHPTGEYRLALAIDDYESNIVGMVTKIIDENNFEYQWSGFFETDIFSDTYGFAQGMPLYISDVDPGKAIQNQPDISKTVGYPIENIGIIISIERGIQYNQESVIGDFKTSANNYNIRSDGFIRIAEDIDYKLSLVNNLINTLSDDFKNNYIIITDNIVNFINVESLYSSHNVPGGLNLFIKAF